MAKTSKYDDGVVFKDDQGSTWHLSPSLCLTLVRAAKGQSKAKPVDEGALELF